MRLLSLDTSFSPVNVAVIEEGRVVACLYQDTGKKTLEEIPTLLRRLGIDPQQVDAYAVSVGVGYLTSLRIGITFVKTLAYLSRKPVVGYENLQVMGLFTPIEEPKMCLLRVSNNTFYRLFEGGKVGPVELLSGELPKGRRLGLKEQGLGELEFFPFSVYGGLWAYRKLREGYQGDDPMHLEPLYFKPPV